MSDMEKTMELTTNPYDRLVDGQNNRQASVSGQPQPADIEEKTARQAPIRISAAAQPVHHAEKAIPQPVKPVEIIPMSDKAVFSNMSSREFGKVYDIGLEIEEDLLVPDTEPDMESILNACGSIDSISFQAEENGGTVKGEISLEIMYRSADAYNDKLIIIKGKVPFKKEWKENLSPQADIKISGAISKLEYRIINERKYRVKIYVSVKAREVITFERKMFEGIQDEQLEFLRENACILNIAFTKNKESELHENLRIDNDKIKPLKVLKSSFTIAENHRQLTGDKLVINETIWVRILYVAELASQGNLSNQPMIFTGKIDNTQFIPIDGGNNIASCRARSYVDGLEAKVNESADGFSVEGTVRTEVEFYELIEKEIVTDFYNLNEDMACDNKEEIVCCGFETKIAEQTIRDTIDLQAESPESQRVIFMDASVAEMEITEGAGRVDIQGKLHIEILTMTDGNQTSLARKITDFSMAADIPEESRYIADTQVFVREMSADIINQKQLSIMVQLQAELDICREGTIRVINNPCILREEDAAKSYPIILCTVKSGDTLWDIAKKYRVSAKHISKVNKIDTISEGMKIVVAR